MKGVVDIARTWVGTPYVHQAATKGAGTDCLGLIIGVWAEVNNQPLPDVPAYSQDWSEPQGLETLWEGAKQHLVSKDIADEAEGDVLLFRMRAKSVAKHLGLAGEIGPKASFIHAYSGHAVFESPLSRPWRGRIVARFEFP